MGSSNALDNAATLLMAGDSSQWRANVDKIDYKELLQYLNADHDIIDHIKSRQSYKKDDETYNRAVFFALTALYIYICRKVPLQDSFFATRVTDDYINAASVFMDFLVSGYPLNKLRKFLQDTNQTDHVHILFDHKANFMLPMLVKQAEVINNHAFIAETHGIKRLLTACFH